jgi:transposase
LLGKKGWDFYQTPAVGPALVDQKTIQINNRRIEIEKLGDRTEGKLIPMLDVLTVASNRHDLDDRKLIREIDRIEREILQRDHHLAQAVKAPYSTALISDDFEELILVL